MTEEETRIRDRVAEALYLAMHAADATTIDDDTPSIGETALTAWALADVFVAARDEGSDSQYDSGDVRSLRTALAGVTREKYEALADRDHLSDKVVALEESLKGTRQAFDDVSSMLQRARALVAELEDENKRLLEKTR